MSLYSQFKPATQGVLLVFVVCLYVPTLRFFTGSRKGLSRGTGDIICTLSSSSVNRSFFPVFGVVYIERIFKKKIKQAHVGEQFMVMF
jgi:hypothetical protein